ncbi:type II toxin-antitoxin system RelE/ParE family toxin [Roseateles sp. MS654]|uniref:type II toxin-antitoxin system RelE/ParE family toxin n=1 Tax=Roseateles sp. MS654 TaxID=3412685 RepID=UPI003C2FDF72
MNAKPLVLQAHASKAISAILSRYVQEGGILPARGFHKALRKAFRCIGFSPAMGSRRWAEELNMDLLRHWRLGKFPHQVFYVEAADHVRILDVIHERRDMWQWAEPS